MANGGDMYGIVEINCTGVTKIFLSSILNGELMCRFRPTFRHFFIVSQMPPLESLPSRTWWRFPINGKGNGP
ncbi:hypothetical protein Y032_0028g1654 [Ancylostoma ceylanicum]|uniref:Uncharacterized protein n=1 Tax=Ancylostoma ceylanicum TaxID=53326 RepID=A0A016UTE5_9BILA|nr:hypothetical protein Y032_0028g1654 [Ancylostoma ceylanicum]